MHRPIIKKNFYACNTSFVEYNVRILAKSIYLFGSLVSVKISVFSKKSQNGGTDQNNISTYAEDWRFKYEYLLSIVPLSRMN